MPCFADIQREAKKTELSIKECAKRGDKHSMVVLAKELLRSRKAVTRLYTSKAQMNSVTLHLNENLGARCLQATQMPTFLCALR
jgi:charged multivesicular body protein 3